jgi:hypothetical protein
VLQQQYRHLLDLVKSLVVTKTLSRKRQTVLLMTRERGELLEYIYSSLSTVLERGYHKGPALGSFNSRRYRARTFRDLLWSRLCAEILE